MAERGDRTGPRPAGGDAARSWPRHPICGQTAGLHESVTLVPNPRSKPSLGPYRRRVTGKPRAQRAQYALVLPGARTQEPDRGSRTASSPVPGRCVTKFGRGRSWQARPRRIRSPSRRLDRRRPCQARFGVRRSRRTRGRRPRHPRGTRSPRSPGGASASKSPPGAFASGCS